MKPPHKIVSGASLPALIFSSLAAFTVLTFFYVVELEEGKTRLQFQQAASNRVAVVERQYQLSIAAVDLVGTLFDTRPDVTESEFERFVYPILERNPALSGLSYAPIVELPERQEFETLAAEQHPGFRITERHQQGEMIAALPRQRFTPVRYLVPLQGNEAALGFDLASDPLRKRALDSAMRANRVRATDPIILVQETAGSMSFLLMRPVFEDSGTARPDGPGSNTLTGYVTAVVRSAHLIANAVQTLQPAGIHFSIHDITSPSDPAFLVAHQSRTMKGNMLPAIFQADLGGSEEFSAAGRRYRVDLSPADGYFVPRIGPAAWGLLISGFAFSLALAALVKLIQASEQRQQQSARELAGLSDQLINVQEEERARLAREIHEDIGQSISAVKMNLHTLRQAAPGTAQTSALEKSDKIMDEILGHIRDISLELRPPMLDDLGLDATLNWYVQREARRASIAVEYHFDAGVGSLPSSLATTVFRYVEEALGGLIRRWLAERVRISVAVQDGALNVSISANRSLSADGADNRFAALRSLGQRVQLAGGEFRLVGDSADKICLEARFSLPRLRVIGS